MMTLCDRYKNVSSVVMNEIFDLLEYHKTIVLDDASLPTWEQGLFRHMGYTYNQTRLEALLCDRKGYSAESVKDTLDYMRESGMLVPSPSYSVVYTLTPRS